MKNAIFGIAITATALLACNSSTSEKQDNNTKVQVTSQDVDTALKQAPVTTATISIKEIVDDYLKMKNAFAKDNSANAVTAANEMQNAFTNFNKAALTPGQAKIYIDITDDAKEHAEHIGSNGEI